MRKLKEEKQKETKRKTGLQLEDYIAPIIVSSTPGGVLAKALQKIADSESDSGIRFRVVEKGGIPVGNLLQKSNPTASGSCNKPDCVMCSQPGGGKMCHKQNIVYEWVCQDDDSSYVGETARNFYTRSGEHLDKYKKNAKDSFIRNHQKEFHQDKSPNFKVNVLKSFKSSLSRQIYEGVSIRKQQNAKTLNSKLDYYSTATYNVRREILHG